MKETCVLGCKNCGMIWEDYLDKSSLEDLFKIYCAFCGEETAIAINPKENIRYYKGIQKIVKASRGSKKMRTALYITLENGVLGESMVSHVIPYRVCWRERKREK